MADRDRCRGPARTLWVCVLLLLWAGVYAADPMPYTLTLTQTGSAEIDQAIRDSSQLAGLRERAPVGPFALIGRAETDLRRFDTVLRSFGYYDAGIDIRIAGLALDDPALLPLLEGLAPSPTVAVQVTLTPGPLYHLGLVASGR